MACQTCVMSQGVLMTHMSHGVSCHKVCQSYLSFICDHDNILCVNIILYISQYNPVGTFVFLTDSVVNIIIFIYQSKFSIKIM